MNTYIIDTEYAAHMLISTIYHEEKIFNDLTSKLKMLSNHFEVLQKDFITSEDSEDFDGLQIQSKYGKMAKFHQENNLQGKQNELKEIENSIEVKRTSMGSLAMSLLQIAKQGISTVHGNLNGCPVGRAIGAENSRNVIWNGRNQAIHCEEGNPKDPVRDCFKNLTAEFGPAFDLSSDYTKNRAKEVIDLLGWNNYEHYKNDMISLLG